MKTIIITYLSTKLTGGPVITDTTQQVRLFLSTKPRPAQETNTQIIMMHINLIFLFCNNLTQKHYPIFYGWSTYISPERERNAPASPTQH